MSEPKSDIIAASPSVTEEGCQPYRVVIRDLGHEFVVHTQVLLAVGGDSFIWGPLLPEGPKRGQPPSVRRAIFARPAYGP
jgi:hypothetical protein